MAAVPPVEQSPEPASDPNAGPAPQEQENSESESPQAEEAATATRDANSEQPEATETDDADNEPASDAEQSPPDSQGVVSHPGQPATLEMLRDLERQANISRTARQALALYDDFRALFTLNSQQQMAFDTKRAIWEERARQELVRLGSKWVPQAEVDAAAAEADALIKQAVTLIQVGDFPGARRSLERASQADPNGIRADFTLGMLNSFREFNAPELAIRYFTRVLSREPNHIPTLNNLALAEIKERNFGKALALWKTLLSIAPKTPEASHNLGRAISEAKRGKLPMPPEMLKRYSAIYAELIATKKATPSDPKTGWLYAPLIIPSSERSRDPDEKPPQPTTLVAAGTGSGFVVHDGYVLTNRHVVLTDEYGLADVVRIVDPGDPAAKRELDAQVVAVAEERDIAILKCSALKIPPVKLSQSLPQRSSEIIILGFPFTDMLGRGVKSTRGSVTALPEQKGNAIYGPLLLFDAEANPGNSGGPVCNQLGEVIAVLTLKVTPGGARYTAGVPIVDAIPLLQRPHPRILPGRSGNAGPRLAGGG